MAMSDLTAATPIPRPAARVVLLDARDRVLLFGARLPPSDGRFWITPGGGLNAGETHEEAALRELWEETGLRDVALGPCVWTRAHVFRWGDDLFDQRERYYLVRVDAHEVSTERFEEHEKAFMLSHRWWTLDELRSCPDRFVPGDFADLLAPILAGTLPPEPIAVGI
jgi:8-oxo-dGTP pyrophosphatase MutT (NUDIX family)